MVPVTRKRSAVGEQVWKTETARNLAENRILDSRIRGRQKRKCFVEDGRIVRREITVFPMSDDAPFAFNTRLYYERYTLLYNNIIVM